MNITQCTYWEQGGCLQLYTKQDCCSLPSLEREGKPTLFVFKTMNLGRHCIPAFSMQFLWLISYEYKWYFGVKIHKEDKKMINDIKEQD